MYSSEEENDEVHDLEVHCHRRASQHTPLPRQIMIDD
jgi:hypothetical protein